MANFVIKRDGAKEPFDVEKIKRAVSSAGQMANLPEAKINEVVDQVANAVIQLAEGKEEIATTEIKAKILSELDTIEPSVSSVWREYEQNKEKV